MILNFTIGPMIPIDRLLVFTTIKHPKYDFDLVNETRSHGPADLFTFLINLAETCGFFIGIRQAFGHTAMTHLRYSGHFGIELGARVVKEKNFISRLHTPLRIET